MNRITPSRLWRAMGLGAALGLGVLALVFADYCRSVTPVLQPRPLDAGEGAAFAAARVQVAAAQCIALQGAAVAPLPALPRHVAPGPLLYAGATIVIDAATGAILYEKNADWVIPPASLTKLVVMYVIFQEIDAGHMSLDDVVPVPPESWAENAPPDSSLMFLGEGQIVTLRELLLGMAVASGNDATVAAATYVAGSVGAFCQRMNQEMAALGLTQTRFVDTSGYSPFNTTTAREFAAFVRYYVATYPHALAAYHSQKTFAYPTVRNYPPGRRRIRTFTHTNGNLALGAIPGCDGIKTGFIGRSRYNLAFTVARDRFRYIGVTLRGPGRNGAQGSAYRLADAQAITEWAFAHFTTCFDPPAPVSDTTPVETDFNHASGATAGGQSAPVSNILPPGIRTVGVLMGTEKSMWLYPAWSAALTVSSPAPGVTPGEAAAALTVRVEAPAFVEAPVEAGTPVGRLVYETGGLVIGTTPLLADRSVAAGPWWQRLADWLILLFRPELVEP